MYTLLYKATDSILYISIRISIYIQHMMQTYQQHLEKISSCPFCDPTTEVLITRYEHWVLVDAYFPYCDGHTLLCPIRHISSYTQLTTPELKELNSIQPQLLQKYSKLAWNLGRKSRVKRDIFSLNWANFLRSLLAFYFPESYAKKLYYTHEFQEVSVLIRDGTQSSTKTSKSTTGKTINHLHIHFIPDLPIWAWHLLWKKWLTRVSITHEQHTLSRKICT